MIKVFKPHLTYLQIIALGFLAVILIGSILLTLPISSRSGETPFLGAMFTATSATCVTGLVIYDTYSHWTLFGQLVILAMIQIGGIGFMTIIAMLSVFMKRRISLHERRLLMESAGTIRIAGVVKLVRRVFFGTFIFEGIGALVLTVRFLPEMGLAQAFYNAVFHSVSAFCNAGFDIMGKSAPFSSLTAYKLDPVVNITISMLIIMGGLGFLVWNDCIQSRFNFKKYELHSKLVFTTTLLLLVIGTVLFFFLERNGEMAGLTVPQRLLVSFFQSVTPRTAGYNTIDINKLSDSGKVLTTILMFIGGSPGSTAGGIKTTTFLVLILGAVSASRHTPSINVFRRRLDEHIVKRASAIFTIYVSVVLAALMIICELEPFDAEKILFEVVSAIGTVGLSMGITPQLCTASRIILMILMFGGRVGGLTLMLVLAEKRINIPLDRPYEKILIG
ncbi:MAG: Trk family potassium uptake protein [Clostridia bacterium]|nr:Trk family potassium uptake protein [Clostridia bacterium]